MNKLSFIIFFFIPQLIFSQIFTDKYIKEANQISSEWLFNLNNKNYAQAYSDYHEKVKYNSDSINSCKAFTQLMNEFGMIKSRTLDTIFFKNNIEGLGDGFYVFIEYTSIYKKIGFCEEYIIVGQNDNLKWKILRYDFSYINDELNMQDKL